MEEIHLDREDYILLGSRQCGSITILTFFHKQRQADYDHDWTPCITKMLKYMGFENALDYCCIIWSLPFGDDEKYRISIVTPEFFEKFHMIAFLYDACLSFSKEREESRIISFLGDGIFTTTTLSHCILPNPSKKRLQKLMSVEEWDMVNTRVYPIPGSLLAMAARATRAQK